MQALPRSQRALMTLAIRKRLWSPTFAIAGALNALDAKLERRLKEGAELSQAEVELEEDFETFDQMAEELAEEEEIIEPLTLGQRQSLKNGIVDLRQFLNLALHVHLFFDIDFAIDSGSWARLELGGELVWSVLQKRLEGGIPRLACSNSVLLATTCPLRFLIGPG